MKKNLLILSLLLTFLGYCGDGNEKKSTNWLSTSDLEKLVAPADLKAACQSNGLIKITWTGNFDTEATDLEIYRKGDADADFIKVGVVEADAGIYSDAVPNNIPFKYRVRAIVQDDRGRLQYISPDFSSETNKAAAALACPVVDTGGGGNS